MNNITNSKLKIYLLYNHVIFLKKSISYLYILFGFYHTWNSKGGSTLWRKTSFSFCYHAKIRLKEMFPWSYTKTLSCRWKEPWTWWYNLLRCMLQIKVLYLETRRKVVFITSFTDDITLSFFILAVIFVPFGTVKKKCQYNSSTYEAPFV